MKMKKVITAILVIAWMILIGSFSAQSGQQSAGLSQRITSVVAALENEILNKNYNEIQLSQRAEELQFVVRKFAHMSEYAILAILAVLHISCYPLSTKKCLLLAWFFAVLYAATDELHQLFVSGRSGQFADVCIDATGALLGILLVSWCMWIYQRRKKRHL